MVCTVLKSCENKKNKECEEEEGVAAATAIETIRYRQKPKIIHCLALYRKFANP